jgi:NAD(P)-dependent dehydrogenase (short-subunit alcohol dehydrogenase family)
MPAPRDMPNILRAPGEYQPVQWYRSWLMLVPSGDYEVTTEVHSDSYPGINTRNVDLTDMAVFITGGSRGLGRSMALSFAKAGASHIAVGARSDLGALAEDIAAAAAAARRSPPKFLPVQMDVTDQSSVSEAAAQVETAFGKLHVLINNAGVLGKYGLIGDSDPKVWMNVLNVNLNGPYLATRAFLPLLLKTNGSRYIINVTSGGAHLNNPTLSAYQISKNALLKLSTLTNAEYASKGIAAIAIHPGNSPTDIMGGPRAIPDHHKHGS